MGEDSPDEQQLSAEAALMSVSKAKKTRFNESTLGRSDKSTLRRSPAEWITLALSSLVLATLVGLVLYDWQLTKNLPPAFRIEANQPARFAEGHYYVPFSLRNTGGRIARTVQVMADLHLADGTNETGEQQFDFLSGNERKSGSFVFEHNPMEGDLVIRVASFGLP